MGRFLATAAVAVVLGLFGASSASASVLCDVNESGCPAESTYEKGTFTTFTTTTKATFSTNLGNVTCTGTIGGTVIAAGGEGKAAESEVTGFPFSECKEGKGKSCTATAKNLPYSAKFEGSGGNGTMTLSDPTAVAVEFSCTSMPMQCTLSAGSIEFGFTGGTPAAISATNVPLARAGAQCPATASFSAEYSSIGFASFPSMFIVGGPAPPAVVRLCKQNISPCHLIQRHAVGTAIESALEGETLFEFTYEGKTRETWCEEGSVTGKTTAAGSPLLGEVSAMTFKKCGGGACAVEAQSLPYKAEIETTTGGNGKINLVSGGGGSPKFEVDCGEAGKCVYKAGSITLSVTGSATTPKLAALKSLEKDAASDAACGSAMTWIAIYKLTKPTSLFVTS